MASHTDTHSPLELGLGVNLRQFSLLVLINAFVGGMVGIERTILPLIAEREFGLQPINVPEQFRRAVEQNLTDTSAPEVGEVTHASGVMLRSRH